MEADFSGYVTKAGLVCSDGRTIMVDAFKHQDSTKVPLVWQHGHKDPENVLGHVMLENRPDGVYGYGFFNNSPKAVHAKEAVSHKDVNAMSIWANELMERSKRVMHGVIREVSLVLSGANPGALIDSITIHHNDGSTDELEDEAIITTGLSFEHAGPEDGGDDKDDDKSDDKGDDKDDDKGDEEEVEITDEDIAEFLDGLNDDQREIAEALVQTAMNSASLSHAASDASVQDVIDSMDADQRSVLEYLVSKALEGSGGDSAQHSNLGNDDDQKGNNVTRVKHNVFEGDEDGKDNKGPVLSHDAMAGIVADAKRRGSFKDAVQAYAEEHLEHGITDIDVLFPDATNLDSTPQFLARRMEWVNSLLGAVRKSPFNRIKNVWADITLEDARARGYIKGNLKKEEFFSIAKRTTNPTTVYKKQKLDRDDVIDITDFDVVVWLKGEMRVMLDEEIGRAILIGDGRDPSSDDKIDEQCIRPIASEHELYVTTLNVNLNDSNSSIQEFIDAVVGNRKEYKGTGTPTMFCSETIISRLLLLKDGLGRRIYANLAEVASELRVDSIVPVEALDDDPTLVAIIVNPVDYVLGATAGGQVTMFDDFDIDYNQQKYLIETRLCGALTRLKSAIIIRDHGSSEVRVVPTAPDFDPATGHITIHDTAHVVYKRLDTNATVTNSGSPYTVASGDTLTIEATPATGYYLDVNDATDWAFTAD